MGGMDLLRLPFRGPLHAAQLFGHLAATAVPGVEEWRDGSYRRALRLPHGPAVLALAPPAPGQHAVQARLWSADPRDLAEAERRCRRLLDLDTDVVVVDARLAEDEALAPWVARVPGRRVPGTVDADELAVRAVLGQQVSTAAARTHAARLVVLAGEPVEDPAGGLTHLFPTAAAVAELGEDAFALPYARRRTVLGLARALADGTVDLSGDQPAARAALLALPGIGPWTVETVAMRAFGDPDAFLPGDLGVRVAARDLGLGEGAALLRRAARWAPYRAYAVQHLWGTLEHAINRLPA